MQYNRASRTHGSANAQTIVSWTLTRAMQPRQEKTALYQHIYVYILQLAFFLLHHLHLCNEQPCRHKASAKISTRSSLDGKKMAALFFYFVTSYPLLLSMVTYLLSASLGELHIYFFFFLFLPLLTSCHCKTAPKIYQCSCKIHKH